MRAPVKVAYVVQDFVADRRCGSCGFNGAFAAQRVYSVATVLGLPLAQTLVDKRNAVGVTCPNCGAKTEVDQRDCPSLPRVPLLHRMGILVWIAVAVVGYAGWQGYDSWRRHRANAERARWEAVRDESIARVTTLERETPVGMKLDDAAASTGLVGVIAEKIASHGYGSRIGVRIVTQPTTKSIAVMVHMEPDPPEGSREAVLGLVEAAVTENRAGVDAILIGMAAGTSPWQYVRGWQAGGGWQWMPAKDLEVPRFFAAPGTF